MNKRFHWVTIQVFLRSAKPDFLNELLPITVDEFLQEQFFYDREHKARIYKKKHASLRIQQAQGFEDTISIFSFQFAKKSEVDDIYKRILDHISKEEKEELKDSLYERVDSEGKLSIRLNQELLEQGTIRLAKKGASIQCYFLLAAYPKNTHTIRALTNKLREELR